MKFSYNKIKIYNYLMVLTIEHAKLYKELNP